MSSVLAQPTQCRGYSIYALGWILVFYRPIALTPFAAMFSTYGLRSVKARADDPSSLSDGFGIKLPILVPFKLKLRTESIWALDAYNQEEEKTRLVASANHVARVFVRARTCARVMWLVPRLLPLDQKIEH